MRSDEPPVREYWLRADAGSAALPPEFDRLRVDVAAPAALERRELLRLESSQQLRAYAGARWTDDSPTVLGDYLRVALEPLVPVQGAGSAVGATRSEQARGGPESIRVAVELRGFHVLVTAATESAVLEALVTIQCANGARNRQRFTQQQRVAEPRLAAVVDSHGENVGRLSEAVRDAIVQTCASND